MLLSHGYVTSAYMGMRSLGGRDACMLLSHGYVSMYVRGCRTTMFARCYTEIPQWTHKSLKLLLPTCCKISTFQTECLVVWSSCQ